MITTLDQTVLRTINSSPECNILYSAYDGFFEHLLDKAEIFNQCYLKEGASFYDNPNNIWPTNFSFYQSFSQIPDDTCLDCVVVNNRHMQLKPSRFLSDYFACPLVVIDHEPPKKTARTSMVQYQNSKIKDGTIFVCTNNFIGKGWQYTIDKFFNQTCIPYGLKTEDTIEDKDDLVLIVGNYHPSERSLIQSLLRCYSNTKGIGYNFYDIMQPYLSFEDIEEEIKNAKICISISGPDNPPFIPLMAASLGTLVITNHNSWSNEIFVHNDNCLLFNSIIEIKSLIKNIIHDDEKIMSITNNAKSMIQKRFNFDNFVSGWQNLIQDIKQRVYEK